MREIVTGRHGRWCRRRRHDAEKNQAENGVESSPKCRTTPEKRMAPPNPGRRRSSGRRRRLGRRLTRRRRRIERRGHRRRHSHWRCHQIAPVGDICASFWKVGTRVNELHALVHPSICLDRFTPDSSCIVASAMKMIHSRVTNVHRLRNVVMKNVLVLCAFIFYHQRLIHFLPFFLGVADINFVLLAQES